MATTVVFRSGGRRFLAQICAEGGTAAILVHAPTTGRFSLLAYAPRVTPQVKTASRRLVSAHHGSLADTGRTLTIAISAFTSGGTTTSFARVASFPGCSSSRFSRSYKLQVYTKTRINFRILDPSPGGSPAMFTSSYYSYHSQTYAGECRGHFSSRAPPYGASRAKQICKCDAVLEGLEKIGSKIGDVSKKIDGLNEKIDQNIADGKKLKMEVDLLKSNKPKGSGDWTSVKIGGKTLNLLSAAAWEFCKAYFK